MILTDRSRNRRLMLCKEVRGTRDHSSWLEFFYPCLIDSCYFQLFSNFLSTSIHLLTFCRAPFRSYNPLTRVTDAIRVPFSVCGWRTSPVCCHQCYLDALKFQEYFCCPLLTGRTLLLLHTHYYSHNAFLVSQMTSQDKYGQNYCLNGTSFPYMQQMLASWWLVVWDLSF